MSKPEFEKGDLVWFVGGYNIPYDDELIDALGTIEAYVGIRYSILGTDEAHVYLVTIDGTTYTFNEDWLEYAFITA